MPEFWQGHDGELESADDYPYWLTERRFVVLEVKGWPITQTAGRHGSGGGISATVYDRAFDREIATYRSEDERNTRRRERRTLERANEHAGRLEAEHAALNGEEAPPTKGTGSSAPCC